MKNMSIITRDDVSSVSYPNIRTYTNFFSCSWFALNFSGFCLHTFIGLFRCKSCEMIEPTWKLTLFCSATCCCYMIGRCHESWKMLVIQTNNPQFFNSQSSIVTYIMPVRNELRYSKKTFLTCHFELSKIKDVTGNQFVWYLNIPRPRIFFRSLAAERKICPNLYFDQSNTKRLQREDVKVQMKT